MDLKVCTLLNERCKRWNHHKGGKESLAVNIVGNTGNESNVSSLLSIVVCRCVASNDVFLPV